MAKNIVIRTRLVSLDDISFFIHNPLDIDNAKISQETYTANVKADVRISEVNQTIGIIFSIDIKSKEDVQSEDKSKLASKDDALPSVHYEGIATFQVQGDMKLQRDSDTKSYSLPMPFMTRLAETTYSTFRGIMHSKVGNTILRTIPLPVLSQEQLTTVMSPENVEVKTID